MLITTICGNDALVVEHRETGERILTRRWDVPDGYGWLELMTASNDSAGRLRRATPNAISLQFRRWDAVRIAVDVGPEWLIWRTGGRLGLRLTDRPEIVRIAVKLRVPQGGGG